MADPKDVYGSMGSVPDVAQGGATSGERLSVRASPNDFGAQVGQANQRRGEQMVKSGDEAMRFAIKQQGIINETLATDAMAKYQIELSKRKAEYDSLEGLQAVSAKDAYVASIEQLKGDIGKTLQGGAQRAFDTSATSVSATYIGDAEGRAVAQTKKAHLDSLLLSANLAQTSMLDPSAARNPEAVGAALGNVTYAHQAMLDENSPGVVFDPETDSHKFEDSPTGHAAREKLQNDIDHSRGIVWENRINTIANDDPLEASRMYAKNKEDIPDQARVRIEASLTPKVINAYAQGAANEAMNDIARGHQEMLVSYSSPKKIYDAIHMQESGGHANSVTSIDGAVGGFQILPTTFAMYAAPGEDINNPADNEAVGKRILDDYDKKYNGDIGRIATAYFSGPGNVAPEGSAAPWINDSADGNGKNVSSYVADIVGRMGDEQPRLPGVPEQNYAKNSAGGPMSTADYAASNRMQILSKWEAWAEEQAPYDSSFRSQVVSRIDGQITDLIQQQTANNNQDKTIIQQAINGVYTKGKPPSAYKELLVIPDVAEAISRAEVHSPEFTAQIDAKIERVSGAAGKDIKEYGAAFFPLMRKIHSGEIKTSDDLIEHLPDENKPGDITYSGYQQLIKEFTHDAESQSDGMMKTQAFSVIKRNLSAQDDAFGIRDPKGEALYSQALPVLFKAIDDGKSKGLTMGELTDPSNPNWIGNSVASLKRTPEQIMVDTYGDGEKGTEDEKKPATKHWWDFDKEEVRTPSRIYFEYRTETDPDKKAKLREEGRQLLLGQIPPVPNDE